MSYGEADMYCLHDVLFPKVNFSGVFLTEGLKWAVTCALLDSKGHGDRMLREAELTVHLINGSTYKVRGWARFCEIRFDIEVVLRPATPSEKANNEHLSRRPEKTLPRNIKYPYLFSGVNGESDQYAIGSVVRKISVGIRRH